MKRNIKQSSSIQLEELEKKFYSYPIDSGIWILLAHARQEWTSGNYSQCAKDINEIQHFTPSRKSPI